jgi:hypothetical protein
MRLGLYQESSAESLRFPTTTHLGVDAANGTKELKKYSLSNGAAQSAASNDNSGVHD